LEVLQSQSDGFELTCMSCHQQIELFEKQCLEHRPALAIVTDEFNPSTRQWLAASDSQSTRRAAGSEALIQSISGPDVDIVIAAIVGVAGLESSLAAVQNGKRLALANKESLVVAGQLLLSSAKESRAEIIPVDSEHGAIHQCLRATDNKNRAAANVRTVMSRNGGTMGDPGSVAYNFSRKGVISVTKTDGVTEDDILGAVLDGAGLADASFVAPGWALVSLLAQSGLQG
jgi:1-deoxy-D-xylulose-5-phosphate reductoisomerase